MNLSAIMAGDLEEIVQALHADEQEALLQASNL
jgi:protein subunit release factor A